MSSLNDRFEELKSHREDALLHIRTFGTFEVTDDDRIISSKNWGREKTIQLFQYLITNRQRKGIHKEQIISRLWEDVDQEEGDRDFKVALHGINKVLEPDRRPRTDPKYIIRQGNTYHLNSSLIWIDAQAIEDYIQLGNEVQQQDSDLAISAFRDGLALHHGVYLPNRIYEDWTSEERERLNVLILGAYISLAELLLEKNPLESVQMSQRAISLDKTWEDAYQIQMKAFIAKGNRPAAIKTYKECIRVLDEEFGLDPLPTTQRLYDSIID